MVKVHMDFGHGGKDPGAVGDGLKEKDITLAVGLKIGEILKRHNVEVSYSRTTDTFIELSDRAKMANQAKADIFVSIHVNSATNTSARGVETFSHTGSSKGAILAKDIQDSIIQDKIFTVNRGIKTANFAVLRLTKMPSALAELGFISNSEDAKILRNKQSEIAESVAKGILKNLGIRYIDNNTINGLPIISKTKATVEQMQEWAKRKGANQLFIDLAPLFYDISLKAGVNPLVTYCQSAKETGYMKFGGVLNASFNNPCGMKVSSGGGDKDPNAHKRFTSWKEGIQAQVDHLALYAGASGYPKTGTPDPRHFSFIKGTAPTVESLGGKWAPSTSYGTEIVKMIKEVEETVAPIKPVEPFSKDIKINLPGRIIAVKGKFKDNTNYINVKGEDIPIRDMFEAMGLTVTWENNMVVIK
ncbi:Sporulation-specific N-acetylmuramoyl-L-alanine amidase [Tissierella praeacuta]|uniref:N-acetylmuramoyl-L-alanine amidase n=1 Tax=Tissierella praeacuta TaxID=43131 RepID=UPI000E04893E|nr:N-acetylmuramoyl-L-alanine amidase [Tissierella praeacuta]SUO99589.1 Sporulation-specific N-acetylmuramoyl-L-alanine amidase [Tissierella praeacuta]